MRTPGNQSNYTLDSNRSPKSHRSFLRDERHQIRKYSTENNNKDNNIEQFGHFCHSVSQSNCVGMHPIHDPISDRMTGDSEELCVVGTSIRLSVSAIDWRRRSGKSNIDCTTDQDAVRYEQLAPNNTAKENTKGIITPNLKARY